MPPLSPLGEGRQQEQACLKPHSQPESGCRCQTWLQLSIFPWCPGVSQDSRVPSRKDGPSPWDTARSPAKHSTGSCKGQQGAAGILA